MLQCDDGGCIGAMVRYHDATHYYRFSMDSLRGYRRVVKNVGGTFTLLWEDANAYTPGIPYRLTVSAIGTELRGYVDGVLTFVIEDGDVPTGRFALYTWDTSSARFWHVRVYPAASQYSDWLLIDGFQALVAQTWTFADAGTAGAPSVWAVDPNVGLQQTSSIDGTYAVAGSVSWGDYRYTSRLRSKAGQPVGVIFRRADAQNFYRLAMSRADSYRRLEVSVAGTFTTLWQDAVQIDNDREYIVTLDCVGDRIAAYLDGVLIVALTDASVATGSIGLFATLNPGAVFREVLVSPLQWNNYFVFGPESIDPAGSRIQVFSGNASAAPAAADNISFRFVAALQDPGVLHFGSDMVDLRLIDPRDSVVHARRFFSPASYSALAAKLLRRADGTGFAIVVPTALPAGTRLRPGHYRIGVTYLRDNTPAAPASQVFSENGSRQPERATLDVPWVTTS
jgi:hypothetical protein